jgi:hypothetical protein
VYKRCRHIRTSGSRCRCAALPNQHFCHYHLTQRKSATNAAQDGLPVAASLELPPIEDHFSVQVAIGRVLSALASGSLDPRHAGFFLYGVQIAASNLPRDTGVLSPPGSFCRVVLTRQNEQVAEAETIFEEEDTKGHKKNCGCDQCIRRETDDPHHPNCGCGECHYFAEAEEEENQPQMTESTTEPANETASEEEPAAEPTPLTIHATADDLVACKKVCHAERSRRTRTNKVRANCCEATTRSMKRAGCGCPSFRKGRTLGAEGAYA